MKESIEDHPANTTRFLVLAPKSEARHGGRKCSLVFSAAHRAGALLDVLRVFADEQLNLTRIESRPLRSDPGAFAFLLDFLGPEDDEHVRRALARLPELTLRQGDGVLSARVTRGAGIRLPSDGSGPEGEREDGGKDFARSRAAS